MSSADQRPSPVPAPVPPSDRPVSFPRGGAGPPQPLPRGATIALIVVSVLAIGGVMALMAWLLL